MSERTHEGGLSPNPHLQPTTVSGERCKLPSEVRGGALGKTGFDSFSA